MRARDRLVVGQQAAEPAVVDVRHAGRGGDLLDAVAGLLLGADEQDRAAAVRDLAGELLGLLEQGLRLEQVDDVDAVALAVDETAHLRVPAAGLVAEVDSGFQQLLETDFGHRGELLVRSCACSPGTRRRGPGAGAPGRNRAPRVVVESPGSITGRRDSLEQVLRRLRWRFDGRRGSPTPGRSVPRRLPEGPDQVLRQRRLIDSARRSTGCSNASRAACRNWRSQAVAVPRCRTRGRRRPGGRSPAGARGSGACGRSRA